MKQKTFEQTVQAMTPKQIIMAMVNGLRKPHVKIRMSSFGGYNEDGICYGCAATNAICHIAKTSFSTSAIFGAANRARAISCSAVFLDSFELAINSLRLGDIATCNFYLKSLKLRQIKSCNFLLPRLLQGFSPEDLKAYVRLANAQK